MTTFVFAMVLGAALLHTSWNALVKVQADRLSLRRLASTAVTVFGAALLKVSR